MVERPRRRRTSYYIMPPNSFNHKEICSSFWIMFEVFHQSKANMLTLLCLLSEYRTIKRVKSYLIDRYQTCYINKVSLHVFSSHLILSLPFILSYPILSYLIFVYLPHQRHHISSHPQCIPADTRHTWTQARHQAYSHIRQTGNKASRNTCPLKYETKIKKEKSRQSKLNNTIMYERQSLSNLKKFKVFRQISS